MRYSQRELFTIEEASIAASSAKRGDILRDRSGKFWELTGKSGGSLQLTSIDYDSSKKTVSVPKNSRNTSVNPSDRISMSDYKVVARKGSYKWE